MSNADVIDFLERMGRDPAWRHATRADVEVALGPMVIDQPLRDAVLARDQPRLEALLDQQPLCCMQFPGKEDEEEQEDDSKETPAREDEVATSHASFFGAIRTA